MTSPTTSPTSGTNPAGAGVVISVAIKSILMCLAALGVFHLNSDQTASLALAISSTFDVALYLGWIRPAIATQLNTAAAAMPPATVLPLSSEQAASAARAVLAQQAAAQQQADPPLDLAPPPPPQSGA